jgi:amino-acid N-acetyltransferase
VIRIGGAQAEDLSAIRNVLAQAGLPTQDVDANLLPGFVVLRDGAAIRGTAAIEPRGDCALLRSLAVCRDLQGQGHGEVLLRTAEIFAATHGLTPLYLLTTTAAPYFAERGFRPIERESVPPGISSSQEFAHLCPDSAVVMVKP